MHNASPHTLLEQSDLLATRAHALIRSLRVRELWGRVGKVELVGSLAFGLMAAPNIDFEVYVDRPDAAAGAAVMDILAAAPGVTAVQHHDFLATEDPGLYWRLDCRDEYGTDWDFDLWLVPFSHPHAGMATAFAEAMRHALTPALRGEILRLKAELAQRAAAEGRQRPRGIDIYRAALAGGVRDAAGFEAWSARNPPPDMETWSPAL